MTTDLRVRKIMDADILRLAPADPIRSAIAALIDRAVVAAPVLEEDGTLCGIITQKDCFRPAIHASYYQEWRGSVGDHMSRTVRTVEASDDIVRAAELFLDSTHRVFPVLESGAIVGMLRREAVLAALFQAGA